MIFIATQKYKIEVSFPDSKLRTLGGVMLRGRRGGGGNFLISTV